MRLAERRALRDGSGPRRRNRRRLFDNDRVRATAFARTLARLHGLHRRRGLPATAMLGYVIIPNYGWRPMFVIAGSAPSSSGICANRCRRSPRWLETQGRTAEAETIMLAIERRPQPQAVAAAGAPPLREPPFSLRLAVRPDLAAQHDRRLGRADHHQHADLRLRAPGCHLLRAARPQHHSLVRLHAGDHRSARRSAAPSGRSVRDTSVASRPSSARSMATIVLGAIYPFMPEARRCSSVGFLLIVAI